MVSRSEFRQLIYPPGYLTWGCRAPSAKYSKGPVGSSPCTQRKGAQGWSGVALYLGAGSPDWARSLSQRLISLNRSINRCMSCSVIGGLGSLTKPRPVERGSLGRFNRYDVDPSRFISVCSDRRCQFRRMLCHFFDAFLNEYLDELHNVRG